jgi:hypothetical protein
MANDSQFKLPTRFVATRGVQEYRATIPALVSTDDSILEIGCEWGTTTALLAARCKVVIGTDVSRVCIERARQSHPGVRFEVLDAFDVRAALDLHEPFSKIYVDLSGFSGYRALLDVIALVSMYATVSGADTWISACIFIVHDTLMSLYPWIGSIGSKAAPHDSSTDQP